MKSMLYVGATLMIGASIYGFADYKQTHQQKEFTNMYESKAPVVAEEKTTPAEMKEPVAVVKTIKAPLKKKPQVVTTKEEEVIPAIKPIDDEARISDKETKSIEKTPVDVKTSNKVVVKKTKKKKLNHKIFSRAPLREEEEIVIEPVKEASKSEKKEQ